MVGGTALRSTARLLSLLLAVSRPAVSSAACPCAHNAVAVSYAGFCWLYDGGETGRTLAAALGGRPCAANAALRYRMAVLPHAHNRLEVARRLRQAGVTGDMRVRVSLSLDSASGQWMWLGDTAGNITADGDIVMWSGGNGSAMPTGHSSGAVHVQSAQLISAHGADALPVLWQFREPESSYKCTDNAAAADQGNVIGAKDVGAAASPVAQVHACMRHCHRSHACAAFVIERTDAAVNCLLYYGSSKAIESGGEPAANTMCSATTPVASCAPVTITRGGEATSVQYSSEPRASGGYDYGTVAQVRCINGTHFMNEQNQLEASCGADGQWIGWDGDQYFCYFPKLWIMTPRSEFEAWQEWSPYTGARLMPQRALLAFGFADGASFDTYATRVNRTVYYINACDGAASGIVRRIDVDTGAVSGASSIPAAHQRMNPSALTLGDNVLVCGGQVAGAYVATCFTYDLHSESVASTQPLPAPVTLHGMCTFNGRAYSVGGRTTGGAATSAVHSTDATFASWTTEASTSEAMYYRTCHEYMGALYVCAGFDNNVYSGNCEVFDGSSWSAGPSMPSARCCGTLAVVGDILYYLTGYADAHLDTVIGYNGTAGSWTPHPVRLAAAVNRAAIVGVW